MPTEVVIETHPLDPARRALEVVERKGAGHPDTLCDAAAEAFSRRLARHYLERSGRILHHNVDKALLVAGRTRVAFGGGAWLEPIVLHLAGRAVVELPDGSVPVTELAEEAATEAFRVVRHLERRHLETVAEVRPAGVDLQQLFLRGPGDAPLANDTSIGVGFAPLTATERVALKLERQLTRDPTHRRIPALGEDVKVMAVRRERALQLTVAAAMVASRTADAGAYTGAVEGVAEIAARVAGEHGFEDTRVDVNAADTPGAPYLTLSGTSAEAGDDGQVGRGNRVSGLITPMRPMTLEAWAGKNPVSHVGKLLSTAAQRVAEACARLEEVRSAECVLVSEIGRPITEPQAAGVRLDAPAERAPALASRARETVLEAVTELPGLWREIVGGPTPAVPHEARPG